MMAVTQAVSFARNGAAVLNGLAVRFGCVNALDMRDGEAVIGEQQVGVF